MAMIKVFDANGSKELSCFDTLENIPYIQEEEVDPNDLAEETEDGF